MTGNDLGLYRLRDHYMNCLMEHVAAASKGVLLMPRVNLDVHLRGYDSGA